jgi:hypothetical protein
MRIASCLVLFAACAGGDGDSPPTDAPPASNCGANGAGSVSGTVLGVQVSPIARANVVIAGGLAGIVLDEEAGACGAPSSTGEHLVLIFCQLPQAGVTDVVGEQAFACPGIDGAGLIEQNGATDLAEATGGTITTTNRTASCITGTFSLDFGAEQMTGSFDALICP